MNKYHDVVNTMIMVTGESTAKRCILPDSCLCHIKDKTRQKVLLEKIAWKG